MKSSAQLITLALSTALLLTGCTKISLSGGGTGTPSATTGGGTDAVLNPKATPPINGDWKITWIANDQAYESLITFAQQGGALTGKGEDVAGPFLITNGTVKGNKLRFTKKYAAPDPSNPVFEFQGDLEWEDDEEYRGWRMGGHYRYRDPNTGRVVDDKWVGISALAEQAMQQRANNPPAQPVEQPTDQQPEQAQQQSPGGEPHISGMYQAQYTYNFKKINTKLWLEQDGHRLAGHGVDTNTNEKFAVVNSFYYFPKVTLRCKYTKGHSAAANRELVVKAQVVSGPALKGETQYGGAWEARIVR